MNKRHFGKTMRGLIMHVFNLQMFADNGGTSGLTGDFDADFAKYVSGDTAAESDKERDAAVQNNAEGADTATVDASGDVTDEGTAEVTAPTQDNVSNAADDDAEMSDEEFESLIKGKGKKAFGARTQKIIDGRFAKYKNQLQPLEEMAAVLYDKYGIENGDIDALREAVYGDTTMFNRQAMESGIGIAEYRDDFKAAREQSVRDEQNELDRRFAEDAAEQEAQNELVGEWQRQADEVKATYPDFDLKAELAGNESFRQLLTGERPLTVAEARRLAYYDSDMAQITGKVAQSVKEKTAQSIARGQARPAEGGLTRQGGIIRRQDVQSLKDNDILNIIDAVAKGAKISF